MIFEEKRAKEIIEKFNLAQKTFLVWKHRGKIPDRYMKEGYSLDRLKKNSTQFKKLKEVITLPEIRMKSFTTNTTPYHVIIDVFVRDDAKAIESISKVQYNDLRSQVIALRGRIRNYLKNEENERNVKALRNYLSEEFYLVRSIIYRNSGCSLDRWQHPNWKGAVNSIMEHGEYPQVINYLQFLQAKMAI